MSRTQKQVEFTDQRYIAITSSPGTWTITLHLGLSGSKGNRFVSTQTSDSLDFCSNCTLSVEAGRYMQRIEGNQCGRCRMILNDGNVTINRDAVLDVLDSVRIV